VSRGTQDPCAQSLACVAASPTGLSPATVRRSRPLRLSPHAPQGLLPLKEAGTRSYNPGPPSEDGHRRLLACRTSPPGAMGPVWAVARFARHYSGPLVLISLPRGTEMFQFPRFPTSRLWIQRARTGVAASRVAPFGSGRLIARLQLPAHVSPLSASFFGAWPPGILPTPSKAWLAPDTHATHAPVGSPRSLISRSLTSFRVAEHRARTPHFGKIEVCIAAYSARSRNGEHGFLAATPYPYAIVQVLLAASPITREGRLARVHTPTRMYRR
jgi:hypothetical protein